MADEDVGQAAGEDDAAHVRIADGGLTLDLRCLTDEPGFVATLGQLSPP